MKPKETKMSQHKKQGTEGKEKESEAPLIFSNYTLQKRQNPSKPAAAAGST